jgi:cytochrome oxidase Cu insertion factor (SCO1/SenC/PrrC family)
MKVNQLKTIVTGIALGLVMAACGGSSAAPAPQASPTGASQASPAQKIGAKAPEFRLPATTGQQVSLSEFQGKPLIVEFLATW